jgi:hypothetical protein
MEKTDDYALTEVCKTAAQLKLRAVHDFFFRPAAQDSIKLRMFDCYNPTTPKKNPLKKNAWLTLQSIHTYVAMPFTGASGQGQISTTVGGARTGG